MSGIKIDSILPNNTNEMDLISNCSKLKNELYTCLVRNENNLTVCQEPFLRKIFWASVCEPIEAKKYLDLKK
jgi:hypothetical protein